MSEQYDGPLLAQTIIRLRAELRILKAERDAAVKLAQDYAREAHEDVQNWGAFASGYFQIEWNLEGDLQKWLERGAPNAPREVQQIDDAREKP